jgi:hypothetical protein
VKCSFECTFCRDSAERPLGGQGWDQHLTASITPHQRPSPCSVADYRPGEHSAGELYHSRIRRKSLRSSHRDKRLVAAKSVRPLDNVRFRTDAVIDIRAVSKASVVLSSPAFLLID